jgi:hypothetical protein
MNKWRNMPASTRVLAGMGIANAISTGFCLMAEKLIDHPVALTIWFMTTAYAAGSFYNEVIEKITEAEKKDFPENTESRNLTATRKWSPNHAEQERCP